MNSMCDHDDLRVRRRDLPCFQGPTGGVEGEKAVSQM